MSTNEKKDLGDLIEDIAHSDVAEKIGEVVNDVKDKVDLEKAKEAVEDLASKGGDALGSVKDAVKDVLDKTDVDDKILEKGGDLLNDVLGHFKK